MKIGEPIEIGHPISNDSIKQWVISPSYNAIFGIQLKSDLNSVPAIGDKYFFLLFTAGTF